MSFLKSVVNAVQKPLGEIFDPWSGRSQQEDANKMAMTAWNLANDYNSPVEQVKRLEAAGLNKYLVSLSGNTAGVPGLTGGNVLTGAQSTFAGIRDVMSAFQGKANLENTHAQTQASTAAAGASAAQANNLEAQTKINREKANYEEKNLIADLDYKRAQTALAKAQSKKVAAEADMAEGESKIFGAAGGAKGASTIGSGIRTGLKTLRGIFK